MQRGDSAPTLGRDCHLVCVPSLTQCHWDQRFGSPVALSPSGQCLPELQPTTATPGFAVFPLLTCSVVLHLSGFLCNYAPSESRRAASTSSVQGLVGFLRAHRCCIFLANNCCSWEIWPKLTKKSSSNKVRAHALPLCEAGCSMSK